MTLLNCGGTTGKAPPAAPVAASGTVRANPVILVLDENAPYEEVIGSPSMPFLNSLSQQYALGANYYANGHDSLPNYFMLTAGQFIGQDGFTGIASEDNVVRELTAAGHSWKAYEQSLPSTGYLGPSLFPYDKNHDPFAFFTDLLNDPTQQPRLTSLTQFTADVANNTLPEYAFVVPNDIDSSHSCPDGSLTCPVSTRLSNADNWLQNNIGPLLNGAQFKQNGLLIIVFDESDVTDVRNGGGHVAIVIAGPHVKRGYVSNTLYQHPSLLRLTMSALGVTNYPGAAASAPDMTEFFQ